MRPPPLTAEDQQKLLRWCRAAIKNVFDGLPDVDIDDAELTDALRAPFGAFVTLKKHGELRGCIGKMDFARPLWQNALDAAAASAFDDPRFSPLEKHEWPDVSLEISVLSPPEPLPNLEFFDPRQHGIIVEKGWHRALLLPKVARQYGWDAQKTLETVCWKAGLPSDAWRESDARLKIFYTFDFGGEN
jgi:AmmeMemoRadiSam system protein A